MEIRDYYNSKKELVGKTYNANIIPKGDNYMLIVVIFIENNNGEFLIQLASKEKGSKWGTISGHPISGENSIQGLKREIKEEIGYSIDENEIKYVNTFIGHNKILDLYYMKKALDISKLVLQKEEVKNVEYMSKEKIQTLIISNKFEKTHAKLFKDIVKYLK